MEGPEDRCQFERPFVDDFDGCPAYHRVKYVPLDLTHAPMRAVWSCAHLKVARNVDGGYYGCCRLGGADDRSAAVETARPSRPGLPTGARRPGPVPRGS